MTTHDAQFLYLTTVGRVTGLPRTIEIWFTAYDGRYYVIAETRERAHWVRNILKRPHVCFSVGEHGIQQTGTARVVNAAAEPHLHTAIQTRSRAKYGWGDGLVVEIEPTPAAITV